MQFLANLTAHGGLFRVRAGIALALTGAIVYLFVNGDPVPADLQKLWIMATTLYFAPQIMRDAANGN